MDAELEWGSAKKTQTSGVSTTSNQVQAGESEKSIGVSTRRSSNAASVSTTTTKITSTHAPKDGIPGMSSFSLNSDPATGPSLAPSKKRKTPGSGQTASHSTSRRGATAASSSAYRETNMLTFESCQGYLENGKLKADDGTTLAINGKFSLDLPSERVQGFRDDAVNMHFADQTQTTSI